MDVYSHVCIDGWISASNASTAVTEGESNNDSSAVESNDITCEGNYSSKQDGHQPSARPPITHTLAYIATLSPQEFGLSERLRAALGLGGPDAPPQLLRQSP